MRIKKQLKAEIKAQTDRFTDFFGTSNAIRFDSHQHTHMIPICYWALLEVIVEQHYRTEYIRITKEPIMPFLQDISLWKTYRYINWIKNLLLNFYAPEMERTIEKNKPSWQDANAPMFLWGVLMSGKMDKKRVTKLLGSMESMHRREAETWKYCFIRAQQRQMRWGQSFVTRKPINSISLTDVR